MKLINIGFGNIYIFVALLRIEAFVVVINRNRKHLFGVILPDYILIQKLFDFGWRW